MEVDKILICKKRNHPAGNSINFSNWIIPMQVRKDEKYENYDNYPRCDIGALKQNLWSYDLSSKLANFWRQLCMLKVY